MKENENFILNSQNCYNDLNQHHFILNTAFHWNEEKISQVLESTVFQTEIYQDIFFNSCEVRASAEIVREG